MPESSRDKKDAAQLKKKYIHVNEGEEVRDLAQKAAKLVVSLFTPVSICMGLVVLGKIILDQPNLPEDSFALTPFEEDTTGTAGEKASTALMNALVFIGVMAVMTFILAGVFVCGAAKVFAVLIPVAMSMSISVCFSIAGSSILNTLNCPMDTLTCVFLTWNVAVIGYFSLFKAGSLFLQQLYLVCLGAGMAILMSSMLSSKPWTIWTVLVFLALWDLFAVLAPCGPLRILIETVTKRGDQKMLRGLVYSTTTNVLIMAVSESSSPSVHESSSEHKRKFTLYRSIQEEEQETTENQSQPKIRDEKNSKDNKPESKTSRSPKKPNQEPKESNTRPKRKDRKRAESLTESSMSEGGGPKLGMGDFVFYSLLVAQATDPTRDMHATIACYIAILVGLALTLLLLVIQGKALPALPISILLGVLTYFAVKFCATPMLDRAAAEQIYI